MQVLRKGAFFGNIIHYTHHNGITVSVTDYCPENVEANAKHYHEHPNISFILDGGTIEKKGQKEKEQSIGSIMFYHAGEGHQNIRKQFPSKSINLEIEFTFLKHFDICEDLIKVAVDKNPDAKFLLFQLYRELRANDSLTLTGIQSLLLHLCSQSESLCRQEQWPLWVHRTHEVLCDRWNETITLSELSLISGANPITISKHFPRFFHCTLGEYMRKIKVEKALGLIKLGKHSLTDIAFQCGFSDQSHFIRTFKHYIKLSPSKYKKI